MARAVYHILSQHGLFEEGVTVSWRFVRFGSIWFDSVRVVRRGTDFVFGARPTDRPLAACRADQDAGGLRAQVSVDEGWRTGERTLPARNCLSLSRDTRTILWRMSFTRISIATATTTTTTTTTITT